MQASSKPTGQVRLALMLIVGVAAAAACVAALMWWKAPMASAQDEGGDPTGANFVVSCGFSHERQVDPIVNPGPSGTNPDGTLVTPPPTPSDHMHHFFGNTTTDSDSDFASLQAGETTCNDPNDTAAYWHPTVSWKDSRGRITPLRASQTFFYYRAGLKDPTAVKPFPPGLKVVTVKGKNVEWRCLGGNWSPTPPTRCGDNRTLVVRIFFPDCLAVDDSVTPQPLTDTRDAEGNTLHVPDDHRSHMVDAGSSGCPPSHPYQVPRLQTNFLFKNIPTTRGAPTLSSDHLDQGDAPGSTMHVDFFNAWKDGALEDLVARCINKAPFTPSNPKPADCS
jgi:Domain of unknown function (DUF1996)